MAKLKSTGPEALDAIRKEIAQKQGELNAIDQQPITKEQAWQRIDQYLERAMADIKERHFGKLYLLNPESRVSDIRRDLENLSALELQTWLNPDSLREKLRGVVDEAFALSGNVSGLSDSQRLGNKTEIEAALDRLYREEEQIFLELKGAGLEPSRRGEEDPKIAYEVVEA